MDGASSYTWKQTAGANLDTKTAVNGMVGATPWDANSGWKGQIAEVIVLSAVPKGPENAAIMQYLQRKWGL